MRRLQPAAQWLQTASLDDRSNGRAWNRYDGEVRAPTGQIWTTLPLK